MRGLWLLAGCMLFLTGCGSSQYNLKVVERSALDMSDHINLVPVTHAGSVVTDVDIDSLMKEAMGSALLREGLLNESGGGLALHCHITDYQAGNAFKRWLVPGWGTTLLDVECSVKQGETVAAIADARREIWAGGAYSIGAWRRVFSEAAKNISKKLKAQSLLARIPVGIQQNTVDWSEQWKKFEAARYKPDEK